MEQNYLVEESVAVSFLKIGSYIYIKKKWNLLNLSDLRLRSVDSKIFFKFCTRQITLYYCFPLITPTAIAYTDIRQTSIHPFLSAWA